MPLHPPTIVIAGAGASGTLSAVHLLAVATGRRARLVLVERAVKVGGGAAFSTAQLCHVLNVPASGMSAFDDDPDHFVRWLDRHGYPGAGTDFVPRRLYGHYLRDCLWLAADHGPGDTVVDVVHDEIVDVGAENSRPRVSFSAANPLEVDAVVLATGIVPRPLPPALAGYASHERCITDPWADGALTRIEPFSTVTLIGTGLSAVDAVLALYENGHRGPVYAISRHGLLPRPHLSAPAGAPVPHGAAAALARRCQGLRGPSARGLLHQFRTLLSDSAEAGVDWREVVDMLRPVTSSLWQGLDQQEQLRFRRHLERLWNVHRHRMAPRVALRIDELRDAGLFHVHAGTVQSVQPMPGSLRLEVRLAASPRTHGWATDWLVNCTGPDPDVFRSASPLMSGLRQRGLCGPGPLGMGTATDEGGRVLGSDGQPLPWMWALGSLRQGQLLESTAVPEIRGQAAALALDVMNYLDNAHIGPRPARATAS